MGLKAFSAILGTLSVASIFAVIQPSHSFETGHVKSVDFQGENLLDVKAIHNGKAYDVKVFRNEFCNGDTLPCLHSIKALVDGQQLPVKAVAKEANGRISIKAVRSDGKLIDIKSLMENGDLMDVKAHQVNGSFILPVKAFMKNGSILSIKGISKSGDVYDIKAIRSNLGDKVINGVKYMADIKAVEG